MPGHADYFHSNHVVLNADGEYGAGGNMCNNSDGVQMVLYNNTIFSPTGRVTECGEPLAKWQEKGYDKGTTASAYPPDEDLLTIMAATRGPTVKPRPSLYILAKVFEMIRKCCLNTSPDIGIECT